MVNLLINTMIVQGERSLFPQVSSDEEDEVVLPQGKNLHLKLKPPINNHHHITMMTLILKARNVNPELKWTLTRIMGNAGRRRSTWC